MITFSARLTQSVAVGVFTLALPISAHADGRTLFVWSGTVDREAVIVMRGERVETLSDGFDDLRDARFRVTDALPRVAGTVRVEREDGRGDVDVIQQPSAFNGYTMRVRVRDPRSGADRYRLVATWDGPRDDDNVTRRGNDGIRIGGWGWGRGRDSRDDRGRDPRDDRGRDSRDDRGRDSRDERGRDSDGLDARRGAGALRFSAEIDDVAEIRIRSRRVDFVSRSGDELRNVRYDVRGEGMPRYALPLDVRRFAGRGNVVIAQYPRDWNDWTTIIRVEDRRSGADQYDFDLRW